MDEARTCADFTRKQPPYECEGDDYALWMTPCDYVLCTTITAACELTCSTEQYSALTNLTTPQASSTPFVQVNGSKCLAPH